MHNKINKTELKKKLQEETFKRITLSFYRYVKIEDVPLFRETLYGDWNSLNIFGRIYVAREGINAQLCVPEYSWDTFLKYLTGDVFLKDVPIKIAVEDNGKSFYKLIVRGKNKIVADGMSDDAIDVTNVGTHLNAEEFQK